MAEPRVLVTFASKMGSTQEIAEAIGRELEAFGMQVIVAPCADNTAEPGGLDGVIIGSAIYTRRWVKAATQYLKRHAHRLDRQRTWLFHSGPSGEGARTSRSRPRSAVERVMCPSDCLLAARQLLKIKASGPILRTATGRLAACRWLADPPR